MTKPTEPIKLDYGRTTTRESSDRFMTLFATVVTIVSVVALCSLSFLMIRWR